MTKTSFVGKKKALKPSVLQKKEPLRHFCRKKEPKPAGSSLPCERRDSTPTIEKGSSLLKIVRTKERKILVGHFRCRFPLCEIESTCETIDIKMCYIYKYQNHSNLKNCSKNSLETHAQGNSEISYADCRQSGYS